MADPRDDNQIPARQGLNPSLVAAPWKIEHVTGFLNLKLTNGTLNVPASVPSNVPRDDNFIPTLFGVDSNGTRRAVMIDHATGYVKFVITAA